jgi:hypothetical protein
MFGNRVGGEVVEVDFEGIKSEAYTRVELLSVRQVRFIMFDFELYPQTNLSIIRDMICDEIRNTLKEIENVNIKSKNTTN